jgi:hypothetical protein
MSRARIVPKKPDKAPKITVIKNKIAGKTNTMEPMELELGLYPCLTRSILPFAFLFLKKIGFIIITLNYK